MAKERSSGSGQSRKKRSKGQGRAEGNGRRSSRRRRSREEFQDYSVVDPEEIPGGPDVLIDVPVVKVDTIDVEVEDLRAQVAVLAEVRRLVQISVGADARLGKVELEIEGVEAQALLKARLGNVTSILERVLTSLDRNPELLESVGRAIEEVGGGGGKLLAESGEAVEEVGEGTEQALPQVGQGASQALGDVGQGAGQAAQGVGQGGSKAVQNVGQGGGQLLGGMGGGGGQGGQQQQQQRQQQQQQQRQQG